MAKPLHLPRYAELQCMSHFTFLKGASAPAELVERAKALGYDAIAVTDECSFAGAVRAHLAAKEVGLPLILGSEFAIARGEEEGTRFTALAMNRAGYGNLCELITLARTRAAKGSYELRQIDLTSPPPDLASIRGLVGCYIIVHPRYGAASGEIVAGAAWLVALCPGRVSIALTLHHRSRDESHKAHVFAAAADLGVPVVATGAVLMAFRSNKPIQDTMTAIRLNRSVSQCGFHLAPNAEQHLRSRLRLANLYPPATLQESVRIARLCTFSLDELRYEYPIELVPEGMSASQYLREVTYTGAYWRYPDGVPETVQRAIEHELGLIEELGYENYFLTVYDIVRFARVNKILCQGRGSAANSAVCFCLGVTEVDPSRSQLLFERFISRERNEPPDIDIDFEHQRREEVIQYVYAKYGRTRAAMTAVVTSYKSRSVLRDVGRALGIDLQVVDKVAAMGHSFGQRQGLIDRIATCGLDAAGPLAQKWVFLAEHMMLFPRHMSQHPCGMVIARERLTRLVPVENATMENRSVVQWDKDDIDALGLLKIDLLGLGMLSCVRRALALVSQRYETPFELKDIPAEDAATYEMISRGDTVGVFQIESRAQMAMLPRMKPANFYDLVIEIAIIRPGPIQGGMIHPYLRRREGIDPVVYPSPEMEEILSRTLGIPIFQEQVMQIAMVAAGFSPGDADRLRRAMAAWKRKGGLEQFEDKLKSGMAQRGYSDEFAASIVGQIRGFAEYGFPESHAASFALIAYASSWLKCHEPAAFLAALLNSQPMGFYTPSQLVQDARRHGVTILPVDVAYSDWEATQIMGDATLAPAVRLGLNIVSGLGNEAALRIEDARRIADFTSVADLARRAQLSKPELSLLASASALTSLAGNRREAIWNAAGSAVEKGLLRPAAPVADPIPLPDLTAAENLVADYRHLGMTLGPHPMTFLRTRLQSQRFLTAEVLSSCPDRMLVRACGIVTVRQRPSTANGVVFLTLEDESGNVNVIVWESIAERFRQELATGRLLGVYGQWQTKNDVSHLIAHHLVNLTALLGELETSSRHFH